MPNSKLLILLCFVAGSLIGAGCDSDHPDLKPGDQLGVDDLLDDANLTPSEQENGGQLIGELPTSAGGSSGSGAGGTGGSGPTAAVCGNGKIEAPELCDGAATGPASCAALGFMGGGTLLCDPTTCTFDDSMCLSGAGGVGGGAGN